MTRVFLIILMAFAVAACGVHAGPRSKLGADGKKPPDPERIKVVYRYFSGKGQIQGTCKPGETIVTVFCDRPNRYGTAIAPSSNGGSSSRAIGTCPATDAGAHRMILSCSKL